MSISSKKVKTNKLNKKFKGSRVLLKMMRNRIVPSRIFPIQKSKPNLMIKSNEFIARDEGQHCEFACELFKLFMNKPHKSEVINIITEAVEIAKNFNNESIIFKLNFK